MARWVMLNLARLRELMANCDPTRPLEPDDERNVDIDQLDGRCRGLAWAMKMGNRILLYQEPVMILATALRGSGKSTELRRLKKQLEVEGRYLVVLVDALEYLDLTATIDVPDILLSAIHAVETEILKREGRDPADALRDGFFRRFWDFLTRTDVKAFEKVEFKVGDVASIPFELKTRPKLRERARTTVANGLTEFLTDVRQEFTLYDARARALGFSGLCVIVDSLEKLRGSSQNWREVIASAEQVFMGDAPYLRLPVHVVYTFPPALVTRIGEKVEFMPMVKLCERGGDEYEPGIEALRQVVRRRIPDKDLREILGEDFEKRRDDLIKFSGGYVRQVMTLLQDLLVLDNFPATDDDLLRVFGEFRSRYQVLVTQTDYKWLALIAASHQLAPPSEDSWTTVDRALQNLVVMRYANETPWYHLHPALRDYPPIKDAIEALKKSAESPS